ncbi:unknown [[Mannheimia] succiniciproducens MBEL55E]|uniref:Uncharacterized protein n=1 Tax=Mannheimia succiniciproducens (strain KCTC 0769BP / MBEL55E) TaxID=221988 RepID=Q65QM7_MANSM|nr:unknown [[Mannheimia] succiniciproducens MBEL55E]
MLAGYTYYEKQSKAQTFAEVFANSNLSGELTDDFE